MLARTALNFKFTMSLYYGFKKPTPKKLTKLRKTCMDKQCKCMETTDLHSLKVLNRCRVSQTVHA